MCQCITKIANGTHLQFELPDPDQDVMPDVPWGRMDQLFSPAYWSSLAWLRNWDDSSITMRFGQTFPEEIAACLLGGYGIPAEVGLQAFYKLKQRGLLEQATPESVIRGVLEEPLEFRDRRIRYRFARQKSNYLSKALQKVFNEPLPEIPPRQLRNWLIGLPGIGPKTASWIVRNWLGSNDVAIIDIHIYRAGVLAGFFSLKDNVQSDYFDMEARFLWFAQ
jgi:thermostable 8-oxoguanine DNA glycosylase